jgi:hypothetical protein
MHHHDKGKSRVMEQHEIVADILLPTSPRERQIAPTFGYDRESKTYRVLP